MRNTFTFAGLFAAVFTLSACGEKPQEMGGTASDTAPYAGVGQSKYQQPGWKAGDKVSWEQHLKARAQYGMNDHSRVATH